MTELTRATSKLATASALGQAIGGKQLVETGRERPEPFISSGRPADRGGKKPTDVRHDAWLQVRPRNRRRLGRRGSAPTVARHPPVPELPIAAVSRCHDQSGPTTTRDEAANAIERATQDL